MGPNDWAGDQCDMTLVGGFSRQGGGISAVLFRVRGGGNGERRGTPSRITGSAASKHKCQKWTRRSFTHAYTCTGPDTHETHHAAWIKSNYIRQHSKTSSSECIWRFCYHWLAEHLTDTESMKAFPFAVWNAQCQAAVSCSLSKLVSPKKLCFPRRKASASNLILGQKIT